MQQVLRAAQVEKVMDICLPPGGFIVQGNSMAPLHEAAHDLLQVEGVSPGVAVNVWPSGKMNVHK
jgi:hypothetical protein